MSIQLKSLGPTSNAPFRFISANEQRTWLKGFIYGSYGSGKTWLAGSSGFVPNMSRVLYLDAESGSLSLSDFDNVDVIRIEKVGDISPVYKWLVSHAKARDIEDPKARSSALEKVNSLVNIEPDVIYRTVVIDSISEIARMTMYNILGFDIGSKDLNEDIDSPRIQDWGQVLERIRLLMRSFRDLDMHFLCICPEDEKQQGNTMVRRPLLSGKTPFEIAGYFDFMGYLRSGIVKDPNGIEVVARALYLQESSLFKAKHRFGPDTPTKIDNPTMGDIFSLAFRKRP